MFRTFDAPQPLIHTTDTQPCRHCKSPSPWRDQRGPVHPACEGWADRLTDQALARLIHTLARTGTIASVHMINNNPEPERPRPPNYTTGPCAWCGQPGIGITADHLIHCPAHMWPPYRERPA